MQSSAVPAYQYDGSMTERRATVPVPSLSIGPSDLGDRRFCEDYGIRFAYLTGAMYKGIASAEMVIALGEAGLMGYFGSGGVDLGELDTVIQRIQARLGARPYGMNLLCNLERPEVERQTVELFLRRDVRFIEAAAFMQITPGLVWYRLKGSRRSPQGSVQIRNRILAKVSRPEVAAVFMQPPPAAIVRDLVEAGRLTLEEAQAGEAIPMAHEICIEADSAGHTDQGVALALMPAMLALRAEQSAKYKYERPIRMGAAGGLGTPEAIAAAFTLGADFVLTGSVNQCTVEAGTSDAVKDMLQTMNVQDTAYAPAGDMFELGAKVQVLRKGVFFPARANKLHELYMRHGGIHEIDDKTQKQIQEKFFRRSFADVWEETKRHYQRSNPAVISEAEKNPKQKMALIFKWYFVHSTRLALSGDQEQKVDFQVHCGPALGAFNQWVRGSQLENWRNRHVAQIADRMMTGAAEILTASFARLAGAR